MEIYWGFSCAVKGLIVIFSGISLLRQGEEAKYALKMQFAEILQATKINKS